MTIRQMRELLNLSAKKFGDKYGIPLRTIQNWEGGQSKCPNYVLNLLERVVWEDYEDDYGRVPKYSIESTEEGATYDMHLGQPDDLEDAKNIARKFASDGYAVELVETKDFIVGFYNPIEF